MTDENAVSPVIGVILMVAITVVLAAVVFVLVTDLGNVANDDTPRIVFQTENDSLVVVSAETADWNDLEISGCTTVPQNGTVEAGERIEGCAGSVTVRYEPTNELIYSATFD